MRPSGGDPFGGPGGSGSSSASDPFGSIGDAISGSGSNSNRYRVKTQNGLDTEVELSKLREMLRTGEVGLNDEAAPVGEPLKPVHTQASLKAIVSQRSSAGAPKAVGASARRGGGGGASIGRLASTVALVGIVGAIGGAVVVYGPEFFEKSSEAGVNPMRRAKVSWERQFPDVAGTVQEHIEAGRAQMRLDTAAGYRLADDELKQAILLDIGNMTAIALWVENFTHLPSVRSDLELTALAREAVDYAGKRAPNEKAVLRASGLLKLALGDTDAAEREVGQARAANLEDMETTLAHARTHLERNPTEALSLVQQVRTKDPTLKAALAVEGGALRRLGAFAEARAALDRRLSEDAANTSALKELARLELNVGNPVAAMEALTRLIAAEERDIEAHLMRAKIAYQSKAGPEGLGKANEYLDLVLKKYETVAGEFLLPVLSHAAYVKGELGMLEEAAKLAERARGTDSSYAPALFVLGRIYADRKNYVDGMRALDQAVRATQARDAFWEPVARAELARVQALAGNGEAAKANFEQVIDYDPRYVRAHFGLASLYMSSNPLTVERVTQAMTIMRRAFDNDPRFEFERQVLTDYPTPRRDVAAYADTFANAKAEDTSDESLLAQQLAAEAMIRYHAGQLAQAENLAKKALEEDRANLFALLYLGIIEYETGRVADARRRLRSAVDQTNTPHVMTRLYLARAELATRELDSARKRINEIADQETSLAQAQYTRAMLMRQDGLVAEANEELKKLVRSNPDYLPAKRALAESDTRER